MAHDKPIKPPTTTSPPKARHKNHPGHVGNVAVGGGAPIVCSRCQHRHRRCRGHRGGRSQRFRAPARTGADHRSDRDEAAAAVPHIRDGCASAASPRSGIGDFHYWPQLWRIIRPAGSARQIPHQIRAMSASRTSATRSSPTSSRSRSKTKAVTDRRQLGSLDQELLNQADGRQRQGARAARSARR